LADPEFPITGVSPKKSLSSDPCAGDRVSIASGALSGRKNEPLAGLPQHLFADECKAAAALS
jgi:hypothetical protein